MTRYVATGGGRDEISRFTSKRTRGMLNVSIGFRLHALDLRIGLRKSVYDTLSGIVFILSFTAQFLRRILS